MAGFKRSGSDITTVWDEEHQTACWQEDWSLKCWDASAGFLNQLESQDKRREVRLETCASNIPSGHGHPPAAAELSGRGCRSDEVHLPVCDLDRKRHFQIAYG